MLQPNEDVANRGIRHTTEKFMEDTSLQSIIEVAEIYAAQSD